VFPCYATEHLAGFSGIMQHYDRAFWAFWPILMCCVIDGSGSGGPCLLGQTLAGRALANLA
jgi:hypothetical protein